jgi:hypothetical protein
MNVNTSVNMNKPLFIEFTRTEGSPQCIYYMVGPRANTLTIEYAALEDIPAMIMKLTIKIPHTSFQASDDMYVVYAEMVSRQVHPHIVHPVSPISNSELRQAIQTTVPDDVCQWVERTWRLALNAPSLDPLPKSRKKLHNWIMNVTSKQYNDDQVQYIAARMVHLHGLQAP